MRLHHLALVTAIAAPLLAGSALAQGTGSEGYFEIHNNTEVNTVNRILMIHLSCHMGRR